MYLLIMSLLYILSTSLAFVPGLHHYYQVLSLCLYNNVKLEAPLRAAVCLLLNLLDCRFQSHGPASPAAAAPNVCFNRL